MQLAFGEWLPDQPKHLNKGANVAHNVYYALQSYKPFKSLVNYSSNTITTDSKGASSFRDGSNNVYNFATTKDTIYQLTGSSFTEVGAKGLLLNNSFATCTITVSDYANIAASETITLIKNNGTSVVFTSTTGSPSALEFQVQTNNNTTATNLKNTIDGPWMPGCNHPRNKLDVT
jgi:restriction endonuclease S subunit